MIRKLFKRMFQEVINPISWCMLSTWILMFLFFLMSNVLKNYQLAKISFLIYMIAIPAVNLAITFNLVVGDYHNMEGKRAWFYRSLPATGIAFTAARALYYLVFSLANLLSFALQCFVYIKLSFRMNILDNGLFPFTPELMRKLTGALFSPQNSLILVLDIIVTTLFISALFSMSISVGCMGWFKKLKAGGPFLIFFISQYLFSQLSRIILSFITPASYNLDPLTVEEIIQTNPPMEALEKSFNLALQSALPMILYMAIVACVAWSLCVYVTDKKISLN